MRACASYSANQANLEALCDLADAGSGFTSALIEAGGVRCTLRVLRIAHDSDAAYEYSLTINNREKELGLHAADPICRARMPLLSVEPCRSQVTCLPRSQPGDRVKNHVLRPLWVAIGVAVLFLVVRPFIVPDDFGVHGKSFTYNYHRLSNIQEWKDFPVKYQEPEGFRNKKRIAIRPWMDDVQNF